MRTNTRTIDYSEAFTPTRPMGLESHSAVKPRDLPASLSPLAFQERSAEQLKSLTPRQVQVLDYILAGSPSKSIAYHLQISQRTVENHRAAIGKKMGARSISALVHSALCGRWYSDHGCGKADGEATAQVALHVVPHDFVQSRTPQRRLANPSDESVNLRVTMEEVHHRLKNIVAVVQSLSNHTMRHSSSIEDFSEHFTARLGAYCRSLDLLAASSWKQVELGALVDAQLRPFGSRDDGQIRVSGAILSLTAVAAHSLGLALHELGTNALKYGALSVPDGKVDVSWNILGTNRFVFHWRESLGPCVQPPKRRGFGRRLIEDLTAHALAGTSTYTFEPTGVTWTFEGPQSAILAA